MVPPGRRTRLTWFRHAAISGCVRCSKTLLAKTKSTEWAAIPVRSVISPTSALTPGLRYSAMPGQRSALRWGRHHLRWGSVAVAETGGAHGNRTAVRRLLHRLPQPQADRTSVVGPDHAARVRAGAGLRGSQ